MELKIGNTGHDQHHSFFLEPGAVFLGNWQCRIFSKLVEDGTLLRLILILSVCQNLVDLSSDPLGRFVLVANTYYEVLLGGTRTITSSLMFLTPGGMKYLAIDIGNVFITLNSSWKCFATWTPSNRSVRFLRRIAASPALPKTLLSLPKLY